MPIGPQRAALQIQREAYESCLCASPSIAATIAPLLKAQSAKTRGEIELYYATIQQFLEAVRTGSYVEYEVGPVRAGDALQAARAEFETERKRCDDVVRLARLFGCLEEVKPSVELVDVAEATLGAYSELWACFDECDGYIREANHFYWDDIDPKGLEANARLLVKKVRSQSKLVKRSDAYARLQGVVDDFFAQCPMVASLKQPTILERHWRELQEAIVGTSTTRMTFVDNNTKLGDLAKLELHHHSNTVEEIVEKATREASQEETLRVIEAFWDSACFTKRTFRDTITLLELSENVAEHLEADQLALDTLLASRFEVCKKKATDWQAALTTVREAFTTIHDIQVSWTRLQPLFGECDEVMTELPEETERFDVLDKQIRSMLASLGAMSGIVSALTRPGLLDELAPVAAGLDRGQQDLATFLHNKCRGFPRFYFVCERTLLAVLAHASNPRSDVIARHMPDVFLGTAGFKLEDDASDDYARPWAVEFFSALGNETVKFERAIHLDGKIEQYLQTLFVAQASALRKRFQSSKQRYLNQTRTQWVRETDVKGAPADPAQIALLVAGTTFVAYVEEAMHGEPGALQAFAERQQGDLHDLALLARTNLTTTERLRLTNLICQDTHSRDVLERLLADGVVSVNDFAWKSQLKWRSCSKQEGGRSVAAVKVEVCDTALDYEFECARTR